MTTATYIDRDAAIKRIRAALKFRSGKDWSVTGGKGTAYGWIKIDAPPRRRTWRYIQTNTPEPPVPGAIYRGANGVTPNYRINAGAEEPILSPADDPWACEAVEMGRTLVYDWEVEDPTYKFGHMAPADRVELAKLLGMDRPVHFQGHNFDDESRGFIVARVEGE
jgi:hypothetical protein